MSEDLRRLPSVDAVLRLPEAALAVDRFGREAAVAAVRRALAAARAQRVPIAARHAAANALAALEAAAAPELRPVFNCTGTILHTNLGRALLAEEAIAAAVTAMRSPTTLEYDLGGGVRGE